MKRVPLSSLGVIGCLVLLLPALLFVFPVVVHADYLLSYGGSGTTGLQYVQGSGGGSESGAQPFTTTVAGTATSSLMYFLKEGVPTDNLCVDVFAWSGTAPSGSSLGQGCVSMVTLTGSGAPYTFTFGAPITLSASTAYALVVSRSGTRDTTNRPMIVGSASPSTLYNQSSGSWSNSGNGEARSSIFVTSVVSGGGSLGGATSTTDQAESNLSTAFFLFLISMFGMIWLLRKH